MAHDVINHLEMQLRLLRFRGLGVIHFIPVLRLVRLLQRQIAGRRNDLYILESIRMCLRNPNPHLLAGGNVLDGESIVKSEMARLLCRGDRSEREHQQRQQCHTFLTMSGFLS